MILLALTTTLTVIGAVFVVFSGALILFGLCASVFALRRDRTRKEAPKSAPSQGEILWSIHAAKIAGRRHA